MTDPTRPDPTGQQPYAQQPPYRPAPQYGPPQSPYGPPQFAQPPLPQKSNTTAWIVGASIAAVLLVGCGVFAFFAVKIGANDQKSTNGDAVISKCDSDFAFGQATGDATVSITNSGSDTASYFVTVAFESEDGSQQYGTGLASASDVAPGQTAEADALGSQPIPGALTCKITRVSRF